MQEIRELKERTGVMIVCKDCGSEFPFTAGEQEFFEKKGFSPPKRCPLCRRWQKFVDRQTMQRRVLPGGAL